MRVINLQAENFRRLTAIDITPTGDVVTISGANAAGKSSVLDAIWAAVSGKAAGAEPVRNGADSARVTLKLDGQTPLTIERTWKADGKTTGTLRITADSGATFPSPQKMLDSLVGALSFDPLAFAQAKPRDQRDMLLEVLDLDVDLDDLADQAKAAYDARTQVNREAKALQAQIDSPDAAFDSSTPDEEVSVSDLVSALTAQEQRASQLERLRRDLADVDAQIAELTERRKEIMANGRQLTLEGKDDDLDAARTAVAQVDQVNRAVRAKKRNAQQRSRRETLRRESELYTRQLDSLATMRDEALERAGMPVAGLGFTDDGVTLNGVTFSQASSAEQLRTSVAIAMAKNPQLRVIRITDGSLLDSANMAIIKQMATENDFQCWVEVVSDSGQLGIVIEDGMVKA